jgi:hypothetical protein
MCPSESRQLHNSEAKGRRTASPRVVYIIPNPPDVARAGRALQRRDFVAGGIDAGANVKQRIRAFLAGGVLALALVGPVMGGPLEDAGAAYGNGDYATAMRLFRPLAEQGDALAQTALGLMYDQGQGVPQHYVQAAEWFRKAADQGDADAQGNLGFINLLAGLSAQFLGYLIGCGKGCQGPRGEHSLRALCTSAHAALVKPNTPKQSDLDVTSCCDLGNG